jgi:hypothetical protein
MTLGRLDCMDEGLYLDETVVKDLERLIGKSIGFEDEEKSKSPRWRNPERTWLELDDHVAYECVEEIWSYHIGLKVITKANIKYISFGSSGDTDSGLGAEFQLPEIEGINGKCYDRLMFEPKPLGVKMIYERVIANSMDEALKHSGDLVAKLCKILKGRFQQFSFEDDYGGCLLRWKISGLNGGEYKGVARILNALENNIGGN